MRFIIILSALISCVIVGVFLFSTLLSNKPTQQIQDTATNSLSTLAELGLDGQLPTHFLEGSTIRRFNKQGELEQQLISEQVQYVNVGTAKERVILLQPMVTVQGLEAGNLYASSSKGELNITSGELHLQGSVLFQQYKSKQLQESLREFRSSELMIDSKNKIAHTEKSVQIIQQGHYIDGVGMNIDLGNGRYQLHSQVEGIHHAN